MKTIESIKEMQGISDSLRSKGDSIGFVPTMGFLHEGHLSLMRKAREESDTLVVSIFVNPTQFGPGEDLEDYPRDLDKDSELCREVGTDILFFPSVEEMYPENFRTIVDVSGLTQVLCGRSRPAHFQGVTTIVAKLFAIVKPHRAYFGLKDYQQYRVISCMAEDLDMDLEVIGLPTVREPDGLAMSSRNKYLSDEERKSALSLSRSLAAADRMVREGITEVKEIETGVREIIESESHTRIDYVEVVDPEELTHLDRINGRALLALAVHVGQARLIDNTLIGMHT
jgi:pantoate--beta-alanine ligase